MGLVDVILEGVGRLRRRHDGYAVTVRPWQHRGSLHEELFGDLDEARRRAATVVAEIEAGRWAQ